MNRKTANNKVCEKIKIILLIRLFRDENDGDLSSKPEKCILEKKDNSNRFPIM